MLKIISDYPIIYILTGIDTYIIDKHYKIVQKLGLILSDIKSYIITDVKCLNIYFTLDNESYFKYDNKITKFNLPFDEISCFADKIVWSYNNYFYSHSVKDLENINTHYMKDDTQYNKIKLNEEWLYFEKDDLRLINYNTNQYFYTHLKYMDLGCYDLKDGIKSIKLNKNIIDIVHVSDGSDKLNYTIIYYKNKMELLYNYDKCVTVNIDYKIEGYINNKLLFKKDDKYYVLCPYEDIIKEMNHQSLYGINFEVKDKKLFINNNESTIYEFIELLKNDNNTYELNYIDIDNFDFDKQDIQKLIYNSDKLFIVKQNTLYEYNKNGEIMHNEIQFPIRMKSAKKIEFYFL